MSPPKSLLADWLRWRRRKHFGSAVCIAVLVLGSFALLYPGGRLDPQAGPRMVLWMVIALVPSAVWELSVLARMRAVEHQMVASDAQGTVGSLAKVVRLSMAPKNWFTERDLGLFDSLNKHLGRLPSRLDEWEALELARLVVALSSYAVKRQPQLNGFVALALAEIIRNGDYRDARKALDGIQSVGPSRDVLRMYQEVRGTASLRRD